MPSESTDNVILHKRRELEFTTELQQSDIIFANQFEVVSNLPEDIVRVLLNMEMGYNVHISNMSLFP